MDITLSVQSPCSGESSFTSSKKIDELESEAFDDWQSFVQQATANAISADDVDILVTAQSHMPFAKAFLPFTQLFLDEIRVYLTGKPFALSATALQNLITGLLRDYAEACGLTLYCTIQDEIPERNWDDYQSWMENFYLNRWPSFTAEYSVLGLILKQRYDQYVYHCREVFDRLEKDSSALQEAFKAKIETVSGLEFRLADRHNHGRNVCRIAINGSLNIIYKPKPLKNEIWMQNLIDRNPAFKDSGIGRYTVLDKGDYGWAEFVHPDAEIERSTSEIIESYSSLLALLYLMNASDMHTENAMICNNKFYPVDIETIFNPTISIQDNEFNWRDYNIFYTAMLFDDLDMHLVKPDINTNYYTNKNKHNTYAVLVDKDTGVSLKMYEGIKDDADYEEKEYRPSKLSEEEWLVFAKKTARKILDYKDHLLKDDVFNDDVLLCRHVPRNTAFYGRIQQVLYHPHKLKSFKDWEDHIDQLIETLDPELKAHHKDQINLIKSEISQLKRGDIPYFTFNSASKDLFADGEVVIRDYFENTGKSTIRKKLEELTNNDALEIKNILIAKYIAWNREYVDMRIPYSNEGPEGRRAEEKEKMTEAVKNIAETIVSSANVNEGLPARWLSHDGDVSGIRAFHGAGNPNFYNGYWGILAFLAQAEKNLQGHDTSSIKALIDREVQIWLSEKRPRLHIPGPGLAGMAGYIKALSLVDDVRHGSNPVLLQHVMGDKEEIYKALDKKFDEKEFADIDYIAGKLGLILVLCNLPYEVIDTDKLGGLIDKYHNDILYHWDGYVADRKKALIGYAHGIAALVDHLAHCLSSNELKIDKELARNLLAKVWEYDRSCKVCEGGLWSDNRQSELKPVNRSWCHGLPGIGMSRLALLQVEDYKDAAMEDLYLILNTISQENTTGGSHHLCCGECGEIDFLIEASKVPSLHSVSERLLDARTRALVHQIGNGESFLGSAGEVKSFMAPDLFQGASGIGYTLLRLSNSDLPALV